MGVLQAAYLSLEKKSREGGVRRGAKVRAKYCAKVLVFSFVHQMKGAKLLQIRKSTSDNFMRIPLSDAPLEISEIGASETECTKQTQ